MITRRTLLSSTLPAASLALCPFAAAARPGPAASLPSTAAFAAPPFFDLAALSPDGTRVAARATVNGAAGLLVHELFDAAAKPRAIAIPDRTDIHWLRFLTDDIVMAGAGMQQPVEGEQWYVSRIYLWNWRTRDVRIAGRDLNGQNASDLVWAATDGGAEFLLAAQVSIYMGEDFWPAVFRVDAVRRSTRRIQAGQPNVMGWTADATGAVRMGWRDDDSRQRSSLMYRGGGDERFRVIARADLTKRETLLSPVSVAAGSDAALLVADNDKGMTSLWSADLSTDAPAKPLFVPPEGEIGSYVYAADAATLIGVRHGMEHRTHWLLPELAALQAQFEKAVPGNQVHIESLSRDRKRMLVRVSRADSPGSWYLFDMDDGRLQRIAAVSEALRGVKLGAVTMPAYKARDGMALTLKLTLPPRRPAKALPVVVMPHGGPWGQDDMGYDYWSQFVASRGYAVLQPNFRGSTGHGTPYLHAGEGQLGLKMQDDLNDALAWAADQGIADPKRAAIMGGSYGGYAAMWGLARDPALWRCGISVAGVSALRRTVNAFRGSLNARSARTAWERMTPDFDAVSPINRVRDIAAPLLLVHGGKDLVVDESESKRMAARLKAAGKPAELLLLPQADHYFTREPDRLALLTAVERFLAAHNPADA